MTTEQSYVDRQDLYQRSKPEFYDRTKARLEDLYKLGATEVGQAEFGIAGVMSGLYIERIWSCDDEEWKERIGWLKDAIQENK